jgi:hypothetical protein
MRVDETPHHDLEHVKLLVRSGRWTINLTPAQHARAMEMDDDDVTECLLGLQAEDYYKSMPSEHDPCIWQDVYRPSFQGRQLYVKFQCDEGTVFVASFKKK